MNFRRIITPLALASAAALLAGCASTASQDTIEQRTAQAIGRSVGQFTITDKSEETGGRINYVVNTRDGAAYSCYMYGVTGFQKAMSFGQIPNSDAVCTARVGGRPGATGGTAPSQPSRAGEACNALLRAAGRC